VEKIKQLIIRLDDDLHKELKHLSIDINKSINEYVVELIKKDLEKRK
jgi:predicted HicB family RNase H-like nuclease